MARSGLLAAAWSSALLLAACSSEPSGGGACAPGQVEACPCSGAEEGSRVCGPEGKFGACDCPPDGETFEPTVDCTPETVDFGLVPRTEASRQEVVCVNTAPEPWTLVAGPITGSDADAFGFEPLTAEPVPPGGSWTIAVTARGRRPGELLAALPLAAASGRALGSIALAARGGDEGLACAPVALDLGFVAPGASRAGFVVCENAGIDPVRIERATLESSSDAFSFAPDDFPITLPARDGDFLASVGLEVTFAPAPDDAGRSDGRLVIESDDPLAARIEVGLTAFAGGPAIACAPAALDFGTVPSDLPATRSFTCENVGTDDPDRTDDALVVTGLETTNPEFAAVILAPRPEGYAAGESFTVHVTYAPVDDGPDAAVRVFTGAAEAAAEVAVTANGELLPDCDFEVVPPALEFGLVERNRTATLEFAVRNRLPAGTCRVRNLRLAPTCDDAFSLPGGAFTEENLPPSGELRVPVSFRPTADGEAACDVLFDLSSRDRPHQTVPVTGRSGATCVSLAPADLDFGAVRPGCGTPDTDLWIVNDCATPRQVTVAMNPGPSGEFSLRSPPPAGTEVPPHGAVPLRIAYAPEDEGLDLGSARVSVAGADAPLLVTLRGRGSLELDQTDAYVQAQRQVDVLWVVDHPLPPVSEMELEYNASAFLTHARAQGIDFQIGVTTGSLMPSPGCVGGTAGAENGRLVPVTGGRPRILTPTTPNLDQVLAQNLGEGPCLAGRRVLQAATWALAPATLADCLTGNCGFLRPLAHLAIVGVTNGTDPTPLPAEGYRDGFLALKGDRSPHLFSFHAIAGDKFTGCSNPYLSAEPADLLASMVALTEGGIFRSLCTDGWGPLLTELSEAVFGPETCVLLRNRPEDTDGDGAVSEVRELLVRQDGVALPPVDGQGARLWRYEPDRLAICFARAATPPVGARVEVDYRVACLPR